MRRSGIARLNLIEILCAAPNCLNLLGILLIAANLLASFFHKFYPLCGAFYLAAVLCGAHPVLKTERERLKFHGAICEPYDPKDMHAHSLLNFTARLTNGVQNRALILRAEILPSRARRL